MLIENLYVMFSAVISHLMKSMLFFLFVQSIGKYWKHSKYKELVCDSLMDEDMYIKKTHYWGTQAIF